METFFFGYAMKDHFISSPAIHTDDIKWSKKSYDTDTVKFYEGFMENEFPERDPHYYQYYQIVRTKLSKLYK